MFSSIWIQMVIYKTINMCVQHVCIHVFLLCHLARLRSNTSVAMNTTSTQTLSFHDPSLLPSGPHFSLLKCTFEVTYFNSFLFLDKKMGSPKDNFSKVIQPINNSGVSPYCYLVTFIHNVIPKLWGACLLHFIKQ